MSGAGRALAVLAYHKVGPPAPGGWPTWFYVPEDAFAAQLAQLRSAGFEAVELRRALAGLADPSHLPARAALVTFDDGYRSLLTHALPVLAERELPAAVFPALAYVGGVNGFDAGAEPEEPMLGWDELRALARAGVAVGSHGVRHRRLSELSPNELADELAHSRAQLEARLEVAVEAFAYPYGDTGRHAALTDAALRAAGYRAAFLYGGGTSPLPAPDRFRVSRIPMGPDTDLRAELPAGVAMPGW